MPTKRDTPQASPAAPRARRLVLASGSSYKQALLGRLGVGFEAVAADIDEAPADGESPRQTARRLARAKAEALAADHPDAWILGADQVIALGDRRFSKPGSAEAARRQLAELAGQTHDLLTAVALRRPDGEVFEAMAAYRMTMRPLGDEAIAAYVAEDQPTDCAGSYKVERGGVRLFESMAGDDYTAIIGLPLTRVQTLLERAGYFAAGEAVAEADDG